MNRLFQHKVKIAIIAFLCSTVFTTPVIGAIGVDIQLTVPAICGNGFLEEPEEACDDGNNTDDDGCSATCGNEGGGGALIIPPPPAPEPDPEPEPEPIPEPEPEPDPGVPDPGENPEEGGEQAGGEDGGEQAGGNDGAGQAGQGQPGGQAGNGQAGGGNGAGGGSGGAGAGATNANQLSLSVFRVFLGQARIQSRFVGDVVTVSAGRQVTLTVADFDLPPKGINSISLVSQGAQQSFVNVGNGRYEATFIPNQVGRTPAILQVNYADNSVDAKTIVIQSVGAGQITSNVDDSLVQGAEVRLYDVNNGNALWNGGAFGQANPFVSPSGNYSFVVPNGRYRVEVRADGFRTRESITFQVQNNIVNGSFSLIRSEKPLGESLSDILGDDDKSAAEQAQEISEAVGNKLNEQGAVIQQELADAARVLQQIADEEVVERAAETVVVPAAATVVAASVAPSLWSIIVPLFRFVFFQPLLLVGRRKRREWGMVYDSITKKPVDLAMIRLIDAKTKKIIQSRVTDAEGRYIFIAKPGEYLIEVTKPGYVYPSVLMSEAKTDGKLLDLYHGDALLMEAGQTSVTRNIPLDPEGQLQKPKRLIWQKRSRVFQQVMSITGIVLTALSLVISPSLFTGGFMALHVVLYVVFERYVRPKKAKTFATVHDAESNKPVANVVVRLFTKEYNKLVASQITDRKGRYSFLVGPETYYMTAEKDGYEMFKSDTIVIKEGDVKGVVHQEIVMKKK